MPLFNVPADFSLSSLSALQKLNPSWEIPVKEVYGSIPSAKFGTGRKHDKLPAVDDKAFKNYLNACKQNEIAFNYTLNFSCLSNQEFTKSGQLEILEYVQRLKNLGVNRLTVALPSLISLLENHFPEIPVSVSVIASVDSLKRASFYCNFKNVKCIYIHESLNRRISTLKKVIDFCHTKGVEVGTILNTFCLYDCPLRSNHYDFNSHATNGSSYMTQEYFGSICSIMKISDPVNVLSIPWIRPEDLDFYIKSGVDQFKITGREKIENDANIAKVVDTYNRREWSGNLIDLFMCFTKNVYSEVIQLKNGEQLSEFLDPIISCKIACSPERCNFCNHCASFAQLVTYNEDVKQRWNKKFNDRLDTHASKG